VVQEARLCALRHFDGFRGDNPAAWLLSIVLREIQAFSYREIAEVAGIPMGTVMSRLARARRLVQLAWKRQKHRSDPMECTAARRLRHPYLDGELDPADLSEVQSHIAGCADCHALYAQEQALSAAIRAQAPRFTAPASLRRSILEGIGAGRRRPLAELRLLAVGWNPVVLAASLLLAVVTSSAVTDAYLRQAGPPPIVQEVVASHIRSLMASHLTDVASSDQHTVKPWFNGRIDVAPPVIDLADQGYALVGGRLDYLAEHQVAALVYRHQQHVINVLVWPSASPAHGGPDSFTQQGFNVVHVASGDMTYWAVSDLNAPELREFVGRLIAAAQPERPRS
jgi:anti-sigma factor RsiW